MESNSTSDVAAQIRHARFGQLPERVAYADMVEERPADPKDPSVGYHPEGSWNHFSCLALDLGL
ncbi:hypothetical protein [Streptomyces sp. SID10815]|uniref:hypothetical protein n=1 Tax=Streptomyces sp. SID10815 TaxID=2706027 RepID=UPI0013CD78AB|nr:hypothetical protein [Streptomyces sp. SID10815]